MVLPLWLSLLSLSSSCRSDCYYLRQSNLSGTSSGTIGFNVNSASDVTVSGGTVGGTFPIVGNLHNVVNGAGTIGTVTLDEMAVNAFWCYNNADPAASQEIAKFQVRETSSNEDIVLTGLTLWNNGNASATDYKDVQLVDQTGAVVATAQPSGQISDLFSLHLTQSLRVRLRTSLFVLLSSMVLLVLSSSQSTTTTTST